MYNVAASVVARRHSPRYHRIKTIREMDPNVGFALQVDSPKDMCNMMLR